MYYEQGLVVTLSTDNRLMSATTLSNEYLIAHEQLGFTMSELCHLAVMSFESAFLPWAEKQALLDEVRAELVPLLEARE